MNNTFDFKRFGQVVAKDWKDYFRSFGIALIVGCSLPILSWISTLILDFEMVNGSRSALIGVFVFTALMFVPSKVYGNANLSREGVSFAMLPATSTEKFFSMVLYCSALTPLIVGMGSWAVDSLLTILPFGGFADFVVFTKNSFGMGMLLVGRACMVLSVSAIFMFGNMVFTKRKTGKTIAWAMLIIFIVTMVLQLFNFWEAFGTWVTNTSVRLEHRFLGWVYSAFMLVVAILFYILTYFKIKTQKY